MSKLKSPHVVKIFFSSPFGGMEEEREELTRRYWPSIAHLCNSHGLQFAAVDMRWGITAESSDKAQVINICLREIDRSDMFVGFFGQRYGWHGADDAGLQKNFDNALPRYPWLADVRDRSVTELEFLHGFLNNPGYIPATLFFRDKMYDDMMREEGVQKGDKKQVFKYSAESEHSSHMMEDLKQRVSENREKTLGVHIDYKTPAEAAKIMYETIMSYLKTVLFADLSSHQKSPREEVLSQHDAFLASRCNIYVHGEQYQDILNKQVSAEQPQHVYITGETGSGKSALLCNWVASLRENTVIAVAYHFCGFADNSTDVSRLLSRIVTEFEYIHTGKDNSLGKSDKNVENTKSTDGSDDIGDIRALVQKLQSVMGQLISRGKKPVLVVDGIDKVTYISKITKVLYWLPHNLPTGSLVVVSTLTSDVANITELAARNYLTIAIQPLDTDSKRDMAVHSLGASGKELSPPQLERIVAAEMTKIPLFLNITMAELIAFGYFRLLDKKIDTLINSSSIEELFSHMLGRLEEDYNVEEYQGNLVEQVLCCIELCSQGMSETILLEMFSIPGHIWTPLYYALENMVIHQGNMIKFGFKQLGDAVEAKYLSDPDKRNFYLQKLVDYFKAFLLKFDKSMLTEDSQMGLLQPAMKLPGLLVKLGDREALAHCLSNFFVFTYLCGTNPYQQIYLWRKTGLTGREIANLLLASFDQRLTQVYFNLLDTDQLKGSNKPGTMLVSFLMRVNKFLKMAGLPEGIKEVLERAINIVTESLEQNHGDNVGNLVSTLHKLQYDLACHLCESYHTAQQGIDLHLKLLAGYECQVQQQGKTDHLMKEMGHCCHGIGVGYTNLKQYDKVIEYTEKSIEHHKACRHPDFEDIATSWTNIGMCHMHEERYEVAIEYLDNSIKTLEEYYFHEVPPLIGEILTNKALCLRRLNRLDEAEQLYFKSLDVKIKAVGREHHIVAMAYMNLGTLESHRENIIKALEYNKQALEIYESLGQTWDNSAYVMVRENNLLTLINECEYEKADEDYQQLFAWRVQDGSIDRSLLSIHHKMAKFYLREGRHEEAYKVCEALLRSSARGASQGVAYLLMEIVCQNLPPEFRDRLPAEHRLAYAVDLFPGNVEIVQNYVIHTLIPRNDVDEVARMVNTLHEGDTELGPQVYVLTSAWCVNNNTGEVNEDCQQRILQEGLIRYPDDIEMNLNMAKIYRRLNQPDLAYPHAAKTMEDSSQLSNGNLLMFVAQTAALAGHLDAASEYCQKIDDIAEKDEGLAASAAELQEFIKEGQKKPQEMDNP